MYPGQSRFPTHPGRKADYRFGAVIRLAFACACRNVQGERREAAAGDSKMPSGRDGWLPFAPPCVLGFIYVQQNMGQQSREQRVAARAMTRDCLFPATKNSALAEPPANTCESAPARYSHTSRYDQSQYPRPHTVVPSRPRPWQPDSDTRDCGGAPEYRRCECLQATSAAPTVE
jgi:hypothetical protein